MDPTLLADGLAILAQCKAQTGDIWAAHYGAGAIAAYWLSRHPGLAATAAARIKSKARAMLDARCFPAAAPSPESAAMSVQDARRFSEAVRVSAAIGVPEAEALIVAALESTADGLHWVGHHFIYAAISLLALTELGGWGNERDIAGIAGLIRAFAGTIPGRSWIGYTPAEVKRLTLAEGEWPHVDGGGPLSELVLGELAAFRTIYRAEAHHDLIGHMLTFSHALNVLHDRGHRQLYDRGLPALFKLIQVLRASRELQPGQTPPALHSPVDRLPLTPAKRSASLPLEGTYWERDWAALDWDYGHVFKFPFSFYDHMRRFAAPNPGALENFRYIVG